MTREGNSNRSAGDLPRSKRGITSGTGYEGVAAVAGIEACAARTQVRLRQVSR